MQLDFFMSASQRKVSPLERLKKASNLTPVKKTVLLSDGTEFEFWCAPLTMAEREQAMKGAKDDTNLFAVRLFVRKAMFEDGRRMFAAGQIDELKNDVSAENMDKLLVVMLPNQKEADELDPKD